MLSSSDDSSDSPLSYLYITLYLLFLFGGIKELLFSFLFFNRTQLTVLSKKTMASAVFSHHLGDVRRLLKLQQVF